MVPRDAAKSFLITCDVKLSSPLKLLPEQIIHPTEIESLKSMKNFSPVL